MNARPHPIPLLQEEGERRPVFGKSSYCGRGRRRFVNYRTALRSIKQFGVVGAQRVILPLLGERQG